ncbi:PHP domain-containing protein [bacterium]|nr:PHP domain-containing protein [bacterium]MBU1065986.1 PHP domain-containing protein [bacterium]MBU1633349.1 PHP domain-containing protein [bacterium]MBU1872996.1 PHP domain-containing protein [bacterium]
MDKQVPQNFDLHTHSNASDGSYSPGDLVKLAAESGVTTLALTDHDTVSGVVEAVVAGKKFGVTVIPGVEISIDFAPGAMHICGYYLDIDNPELQAGLNFVQVARRNRNPRIIEKLKVLGLNITLDEVKAAAGPDQLGRPHFAKVLVQKGYANDTQEAFNKYLAKGAPAYMDKQRLPLAQAVAMIKAAGGVAVLAHPVQLRLETMADYLTKFKELKAAGVEGIEAFNSYQSEAENQQLYRITKELDMLITAGSDFHGEIKPKVKLGQFGENVPLRIEDIIEAIQATRKNLKLYELKEY